MTVCREHISTSLLLLPTTTRPVNCLIIDNQVALESAEYAMVSCSDQDWQLVRSLRKRMSNWLD